MRLFTLQSALYDDVAFKQLLSLLHTYCKQDYCHKTNKSTVTCWHLEKHMVPCWFLTQKKGLGKMFVYMDAQCYTSSFGKNGAQSNSYLSSTATFYNTHASRALLLLPMRYFICKPQGVAKVFSCGKGGYERVDSRTHLAARAQ